MELFIAGLLGGLTGRLIAYFLKLGYSWFDDKYINIGSPWHGEQIQRNKDYSEW